MNTILHGCLTFFKALRTRAFAVVVLMAALSVTVYAANATIHAVTIYDDELKEPLLLYTAEKDLSAILQRSDILVGEHDEVFFSGFENGVGEIIIERAFPVTVSADGSSQTIYTTGGTVRDVMKSAGVEVDDDDLINMATTDFVGEDDEITVNRVSYKTAEITEDIPFETVIKETPLLRTGRQEVLQTGHAGVLSKVYSQRTIDGVVEENTLVAENIKKNPIDQIVLVGANVPVSDLDFGYQIVNHKPTKYKTVIQGARASGYSAGSRAKGASGNSLFYGHVAVDPNVIPYNSKLYIASPDGSFVYGYAIASDTGIALMDGIIDVDLYYETYRESQLNSIRSVDIYVLE